MARTPTSMKDELSRLQSSFKHDEAEARSNALDADIKRIGEFLPKESVWKYLKESDKALLREFGDQVLLPELSVKDLAEFEKLPQKVRDNHKLPKVAGKTCAELEKEFPLSEEDYSVDIERVRWYLPQFWLSTLSVCCIGHKEHFPDSALSLRDDLLPEQSKEEIEQIGGTYLEYMRRDVCHAGIIYEEQQNACYAEFVEHIKQYCAAHPEGLVLNSYDNVRLIKVGGQFFVR